MIKIKKYKAKSLALGAAALFTSISAYAGPMAYVPTSTQTTVIDTATNIPVGIIPPTTYNIEVGQNGNTLYMTGPGYPGNKVSVYDAATGGLLATIPTADAPSDLTVSLAANRSYATNSTAGTVTAIDMATNTVIDTITVNPSPSKVVVSYDGSRAYVSYGTGEHLTVIDTTTNGVIGEITLNVGSTPSTPYIRELIASSTDHYAYALSQATPNYIHIIDTDTDTEVARFSTFLSMGSIAVAQNKLYLVSGISWGDDVYVYDRLTGAPITSFDSGVSLKIARALPDGSAIYVTATETRGTGTLGEVVVIDTATDTIPESRALTELPRGDLAIAPIPEQVAGSATAVNQLNVVCTNLTTSQQITIPLPAGDVWNCENQGLVVNSGDQVNMRVTGKTR